MKPGIFLKNIFFIAFLTLLVGACSSPSSNQTLAASVQPSTLPVSGGKPIKLGAIFPLTGDLANLGEQGKNGLQFAVDRVNAAGGILALGGAKVELVWGDSQGKPEIGRSEVTRLVQQENVVAIIGGDPSEAVALETQEAERLTTPFVVSQAPAAQITSQGFQYTFRICPQAGQLAQSQVTFAKDLKTLAGLKIQRVALLYADDEAGISTAAAVKQSLQDFGLELVVEVKYSATAADLASELAQIPSTGVDAVLVVSHLNDAILVARARQSAGLTDLPFIDAGVGTVDSPFIEQLGPAAAGWFSVVDYTPYAAGAEALNLKYKAKFGVDITGRGVYAYQAAWVIASALEASASVEHKAVRDALSATSLPSGPRMILPADQLTLDQTGQNPTPPLFVVQVQGKAFMPIWPAGAAARPVVVGK